MIDNYQVFQRPFPTIKNRTVALKQLGAPGILASKGCNTQECGFNYPDESA